MDIGLSLYVPYIHNTCSEQIIKDVFNKLLLGEVKNVELFMKPGYKNGFIGFIHLNCWYDNIASNNLREKIYSTGRAKIVYDDPYYWNICKINKTTEEKLDCAFMMIENLQERVRNLEYEKSAFPPPPRLKRSNNI